MSVIIIITKTFTIMFNSISITLRKLKVPAFISVLTKYDIAGIPVSRCSQYEMRQSDGIRIVDFPRRAKETSLRRDFRPSASDFLSGTEFLRYSRFARNARNEPLKPSSKIVARYARVQLYVRRKEPRTKRDIERRRNAKLPRRREKGGRVGRRREEGNAYRHTA